MDLIYSIYYNSSLYILTKKEFIENIPLPELILMYIFYGGNLFIFIIGIYIILSSKRFFPPIYFSIEDIFKSDEYGLSGLIQILAGSFFLFPLYSWYFFFILLLILLMWWIYKKLMIR